jgi:hypothetical protein
MDDPRVPIALPEGPAAEKPSAARMYDYMLGGFHNVAIDREAVARAAAVYPDAALAARGNRAFLRRAVTYLIERGIDQFLDLGSGIPTAGNVHEVAQRADPAARVVYVDLDPTAVAHSRALLHDNPGAIAIQADARRPAAILARPEVRRLLDLERPVGLLLLTLLHFVANDTEAYGLVATLRDAVTPGSYLALSHGTYEGAPAAVIGQVERLYAGTANPVQFRAGPAIAHFFAGWELVEPGLVHGPVWHPDDPDDPFRDEPGRSLNLVGVGRKP